MATLSTPYGYVRGRFLLVVGDTSSDPDAYPDAIAAVGSVTFTPVTTIRIVDGVPPLSAITRPVVTTIDANGDIVDPSGNVGVWLVTGQYDVTFSFVGVAFPGFRIDVQASHTAEAPLDLTLAAPLVPSPAERFVVNEQVYLDTLAARDEAINAKNVAANSEYAAGQWAGSAWSAADAAETARDEAVAAAESAGMVIWPLPPASVGEYPNYIGPAYLLSTIENTNHFGTNFGAFGMCPFIISVPIGVNGLFCRVNTPDPSATLALGLWDSGPTGLPRNYLGGGSLTPTAAGNPIVPVSLTLPPGLYWGSLAASSRATLRVRSGRFLTSAALSGYHPDAVLGVGSTRWATAGAGAWNAPANVTGINSGLPDEVTPLVGLRRATY